MFLWLCFSTGPARVLDCYWVNRTKMDGVCQLGKKIRCLRLEQCYYLNIFRNFFLQRKCNDICIEIIKGLKYDIRNVFSKFSRRNIPNMLMAVITRTSLGLPNIIIEQGRFVPIVLIFFVENVTISVLKLSVDWSMTLGHGLFKFSRRNTKKSGNGSNHSEVFRKIIHLGYLS